MNTIDVSGGAWLATAAAVTALPAWWTLGGRRRWRTLCAGFVLAAAVLLMTAAAMGLAAGRPDGTLTAAAVIAVTGASVAVGGPLTTLVLRQSGSPPSQPGVQEVLRGGAWIGALERTAVTGTLLAGWPEGVAVVLAVKGLGRYPELRNARDSAGAAERFIIGTGVSVIWAAGTAGAAWLL